MCAYVDDLGPLGGGVGGGDRGSEKGPFMDAGVCIVELVVGGRKAQERFI